VFVNVLVPINHEHQTPLYTFTKTYTDISSDISTPVTTNRTGSGSSSSSLVRPIGPAGLALLLSDTPQVVLESPRLLNIYLQTQITVQSSI